MRRRTPRALVPGPLLLLALACGSTGADPEPLEEGSSHNTNETSTHSSQGSEPESRSNTATGDSPTSEQEGGGGAADVSPAALTVPLFVAVGWGGRRVASCDGGKTWPFDVSLADESEDDWHRPYTPKGLAAGGDSVVFLTGWGAENLVHVTRDGATWETHETGSFFGGIGYSEERYVLVGNRGIRESEDGLNWLEVDGSSPSVDRETAAFDEAWIAGADGTVEIKTADAWSTMTSCAQGSHHAGIGHAGGFAAGDGVVISIAESGHICRYDVTEQTELAPAELGASLEGKPVFIDGLFHAATGDALRTSPKGDVWRSDALPGGVRFDHIARSEEGLWVGVSANGDDFYYSENGDVWNVAEGQAGNGITRLSVGRIAPHADCPLL